MPRAPMHFAISKAIRFANYKAGFVCWVESAMISQRKGWHCACDNCLTHDSNFWSAQMADVIFIFIAVVFFIISWIYVRGCDRL